MPFRRWFPNVCLALAVAGVVLPFPVLAGGPIVCAPAEPALTAISEEHHVLSFRPLRGGEISFAAFVYNNSEPPPTDIPWQDAWLGITRDGYGMLIVGAGGRVCDWVGLDPSALRRFLKALDGERV